MSQADTPVLLLIFNRPDKVQKLVEALEKVRPKKIYVSADGPRSHIDSDVINCEKARSIATNLPWECEIHTNFSNNNLGCMYGPVRGVSWFFENEEMGIILEDDCIPTLSFFNYVTGLLEKYKNDEKIMHINGTSFLTQEQTKQINSTYYFSAITFVWGWASWRRAWKQFDIEMKEINKTKILLLQNKIFLESKHAKFWINLFNHVKNRSELGIWDAQWAYTVMSKNGITITPTQNLIENIGFGDDATHTIEKFPHARKSIDSITDIKHPTEIYINKELDRVVMDKVFYLSLWKKITIFARSISNKMLSLIPSFSLLKK